jgi:transglutaminase-like putative cysteine protease
MQLQSHNLTDYLQCTAAIDWQTPAIIEQTQAVTASLRQDVAKAKALFEWVRDMIPHSSDRCTSLRALWPYLPAPFAEEAVCRTAEAFLPT